jgi:hypothetical protein
MRNIFRRKRGKIQHLPPSQFVPKGRPEGTADEGWSSWSVALDNSVKLGDKCSVVLPGSVTTPSLIRMLEPDKTYPYVAIRYIAGCGGAFPIEFLSDESEQPKHEDSWRIVMSNPYENGKLTQKARQAVLAITEVAFNRAGGRFKMYAVFAEDDCVCFELDGSRVQHTSAPSMTIDLSNNLRLQK